MTPAAGRIGIDAAAYDPRRYAEGHLLGAGGLVGWLARRRAAAILSLTRLAMRRTPTRRVLDLGCGYGEVLGMLPPGLELTGVEINDAALPEAARRNPTARFVQADAAALPFSPDSFDLVICSEVMEHVDDPGLLARALCRIVRPGGHVCLTVPNELVTTLGRFVLGKRPCRSPAHKTVFTPGRLARTMGLRRVARANVPLPGLPFLFCSNTAGLFERPGPDGNGRTREAGPEAACRRTT
jgi:SAM-dependent methyltransferase